MAQSNVSNLRGFPAFWPNHTMEPPQSWSHWSDPFQLAIMANENLDIDNISGPEVPESQIPILEQSTGSESEKERNSREARIRITMNSYEAAQFKRISDETKKFGGLRRAEADKKLRSIICIALGKKRRKGILSKKNTRVKILAIYFRKFWDLLNPAFNKPPNFTIERYKLLNRKERERESFEQFWGALTDLASTCNFRESEEA